MALPQKKLFGRGWTRMHADTISCPRIPASLFIGWHNPSSGRRLTRMNADEDELLLQVLEAQGTFGREISGTALLTFCLDPLCSILRM